MCDTERIIMIMRYVYVCDTFLKNEYLNKLNNYTKSNNTYIEEVLELYRAKIRYEAFREFCHNIDRILYGWQ